MAHNVDIGRLDDSTDINAKLTETYYNLALGYIRLGKLEAAGEAVSEALCLDPNYELARKLLKKMKYAYCDCVLNFLNKDQYSTAITPFEDGFVVNTDYMEANWKDVLVYLEQGELGEAKRVVNRALGFDSDDKIDLAYWFDSDYWFACALLEKIKRVYYDRGITFLVQNQYYEAITNFEDAIAIDVSFTEAYVELQNAYFGFKSCYLRQLEMEEEAEENNVMKHYLYN